jgi:hypothetical protein
MHEIVTWKWKKPGYRSSFDHNTVNIACSMFLRNFKLPHRFTCITDDPAGIDSSIRVIDIRTLPSYAYLQVGNPSNKLNPSCYVRLFMYSKEARDVIGERIISTDLDIVLTGDVTPLFDRKDEFVIWGGQSINPRGGPTYNWFNGSLQMLTAGTRTRVWDDFDPARSPALANAAGCKGSDQGWIAHSLGKRESIWGTGDGVYSYRVHVLPGGGKLPRGARFVAFHGVHDPWQATVKTKHSWVREHYR